MKPVGNNILFKYNFYLETNDQCRFFPSIKYLFCLKADLAILSGLIPKIFSLKINKLPTFSEISQGWQCLKIVFIWSDELTYRVAALHYVLNLRYRPHFSKDLYYKPQNHSTVTT